MENLGSSAVMSLEEYYYSKPQPDAFLYEVLNRVLFELFDHAIKTGFHLDPKSISLEVDVKYTQIVDEDTIRYTFKAKGEKIA